MNEFRNVFKVGDRAINRRGWYTVEGFDDGGMLVRYEDSTVGRLTKLSIQLRILENMLIDTSSELDRMCWERGFEIDEEDTEALARAAEAMIVPELNKLIVNKKDYKVLRKAAQEYSGDYGVYVILLSQLSRRLTWGYHSYGREGTPCVYVGQSWYSPEERFEMHKNHEHSSYYVRRFGLVLLPSVYKPFHSLSREMALATESSLADALGELGCRVFGGH